MTKPEHIPVLASEVIDLLAVQNNQWYVDLTFGRGGHTKLMLEQGAKVLAFDHDHQAIEHGYRTFTQYLENQHLVLEHHSFTQLQAMVTKHDISPQGLLVDFGTSTDQLISEERGFSFQHNAQLDMRMDTRQGVTAADLLNALPANQLSQLFIEFGGEHPRIAKKVAQEIEKKRTEAPIQTTHDLTAMIEKHSHRKGKLHPATKIFQALRIAVNTELDNIQQVLPQITSVLPSNGTAVAISFHEGEDALVKQYLHNTEGIELVNKKPITPSTQEVTTNPRARSAKLRAWKKI